MRGYTALVGSEEARSTVTLGQLRDLAIFLDHHLLVGPGQGYPAFAAALARLARRGGLASGAHVVLAFPLGTPEARRILAAELLDGQGDPRLGVAKVLSWAYRNAGELTAWRDSLDQNIAASQGDTKALWLAAKGYAVTLLPERPNLLRRKRWLNRALAAAGTEQGRLVVLGEFAEHYRRLGRPDVGAEMLESLQHQFSGEALAAVEDLHQQLEREAERRRARAVRERIAAERSRARAHRR